MGRRKSYDPDEVVARAMRLFWERGYHATSTRELTEAMGVNPCSLYAEFGSKEGLFQASVDRYMETVFTRHFGRLEAPGSGLADAIAVVDWFGDNGTREHSDMGCLMTNSSTERAPSQASSRQNTEAFVTRLTGAFERALRQASARGELVEGAPVDRLAAALATHLVGLFVLSRARADPSVIRAASDHQLAMLEGYRAATP